jgi:hypothetical protein
MKESQTKRFCRCIKKVRKTIKARKGSSKESGAIGVCVKSVLQQKLKPTGRTLFKFHCKTRRGAKGRVITQPQKGGRDNDCKQTHITLTSIPTGEGDSITIRKSAHDIFTLKPGTPILSIGLGSIFHEKRHRRSKSRSASGSMSNLVFQEAHYKTLHVPDRHRRPTLDQYQITKLQFTQGDKTKYVDCEDFEELANHIVPV